MPENENPIKRNNLSSSEKKRRHADLAAKILSILAALILWFYAIDMQTTQFKKDFYGIAVTLENFSSEQGLDIISGRDSTVDVVLSGTKAQINSLNSSDIKASVDLSSITEAGTYRLDVMVTVPSNISVVEKSVSFISVDIDKTVGKTIPVELSMTYMLPDSYEFGEIAMSQKNMYVSGPQDIVDTIVKGKVKLDLGNVENRVTSKCSIVLVDSNDNEVSSPYIKKSESTVDVTVPVLKSAKKKVDVQMLDSSFKYEFTVSPEEITVKGEVNEIDAMDKVITEPLDVTKTGTTGVRLSLPSDISAYDDNGNLISTVTVSITSVVDTTVDTQNEEAVG